MQHATTVLGILTSGLVFVLIIVGIFLVARVVVLWYWKVDRIVELLEKIEQHLGGPR